MKILMIKIFCSLKKKLIWSGHVVRVKGSLTHAISHGKVEGKISRGKTARNRSEEGMTWLSLNEMWMKLEDLV